MVIFAFTTQMGMAGSLSKSNYNRKIVVFKDKNIKKEKRELIIKSIGAIKLKDLESINVSSILIPIMLPLSRQIF